MRLTKFSKSILVFAVMAALSSCGVQYPTKTTVGDPSAFNGSANGADLLPALNTKCGTSNCMQ